MIYDGDTFEFTTYKVLATSKSDGFVEFVPNCATVYDILKKYDDKPTWIAIFDLQAKVQTQILLLDKLLHMKRLL